MCSIDQQLHDMGVKFSTLSTEAKEFLNGKKNRALPVRKGLLEIQKQCGIIRREILEVQKKMPVKSRLSKKEEGEIQNVIINDIDVAKVEAVDPLLDPTGRHPFVYV